ncbi:MAG: hypothetical protein K6E32_06155 [Lachnospiraceae bacterium]|nr:hypothetical protein [Lachnospiraceae bacterium]
MTGLLKPLFEVNTENENAYGGAQHWFPKKRLQNSGCGVIACANIIAQTDTPSKHARYATCPDPAAKEQGKAARTIDQDTYMRLARKMSFYLPVIPGLGINGVVLAIGINLYFLFHGLPYIAFWGISRRRRDKRIRQMLSDNIPVCLSIGPNFPNIFGKHFVTLYRKQGGNYLPDTNINAHYVSVTGIDDDWYEISSWGRRLYINKSEYDTYVKKHTGYLLSNILCVKTLR